MTESDKREYTRPVNAGRKLTVNRTFSLHHGDVELLNKMAEQLGTSNSEVMRSALRHFAAHLAKWAEK